MNNQDTKELCLQLMKAEKEEEVISIIQNKGFWDNPIYWRYYGDKENNYSAAGNQADEAEAALVEKITNSRDAILMAECIINGINPKGNDAPAGVREAVAQFFEENPNHELAGQIKEWDNIKRREVAKLISVYITGNKPKDGYPCINFADQGEGQTPLYIPRTILSLGESIKRSIRFVHGKWNMGGTAALVYCGKNNLQFVLSKRNPKILNIEGKKDLSDYNWGFTIVRREDPIGIVTSSTYKYLAPINAVNENYKGDLLNFESTSMPILPKYNEPYSVESEWGTLVKLYEYETRYKQSVQGSGGLLRPLDLLVPDLGLPFRLHECRYEGDPGSFEHQVNGLRVRLHDQKDKVLEPGYPTYYNPENIEGEKLSIAVYAFKEDKAKNYRENDKGVIFVLNGQSQGWIDDRIFTRNKVGLGFLKNSLFVIVDCSELTYRGQEKLFVNDRVHIRKGTEFFNKIEEEIIDYLSTHHGLSELQEERKRRLRAEKLDDSKPLESVLANVFKHSSALSKIFLKGEKLSSAFRSVRVKMKEKIFEGQQYPDYFKFKKLDYGEILNRDAFIGTRSRISFETDAANDYFNRKTNKGIYRLFSYNKVNELKEVDLKELKYGLNLFNGIATLNIDLDSRFCVGETLRFVLEVTDPMRIAKEPFSNEMILNIKSESVKDGSNNSKRIKPPDRIPGNDRDKPSGISFPKIYKVYEKDWEKHEFTKASAMQVIKSKVSENDKDEVEFTFYINMDNIYLQHEIKEDIVHKNELEAYFEYGMALIGISIIYDDQQSQSDKEKFEGIESRINDFSRAMGPFIIPIIKEFHDIDLKEELIKELAN